MFTVIALLALPGAWALTLALPLPLPTALAPPFTGTGELVRKPPVMALPPEPLLLLLPPKLLPEPELLLPEPLLPAKPVAACPLPVPAPALPMAAPPPGIAPLLILLPPLQRTNPKCQSAVPRAGLQDLWHTSPCSMEVCWIQRPFRAPTLNSALQRTAATAMHTCSVHGR